MHCLDVQVELQAYVDRDLSQERAILVEQHLAGCDGCRAKLARLQAVEMALETWPLAVEPADFTARVMDRVRSRPVLPTFRLYWSDLAISLAGAGLVFAVLLAWRYLSPAAVDYWTHAQIGLRLEVVWLETLLVLRRLGSTGSIVWGMLLGGATLAITLVIAVWNLTVWERETLSA
jgi:predicted anti-sigma-YlaC factor YlaD